MAKYAYHRVDANAAQLYALARLLGMSVEMIGRPVDAIVGAYGLCVVVEVKTGKGKLRPGQVTFLNEFRGAKAIWRTEQHVHQTHQWLKTAANALPAGMLVHRHRQISAEVF